MEADRLSQGTDEAKRARARATLMLAGPMGHYVGLVAAVDAARDMIALVLENTNLSIDKAARIVLLGRLIDASKLKDITSSPWAVLNVSQIAELVSSLAAPWERILDGQLLAPARAA